MSCINGSGRWANSWPRPERFKRQSELTRELSIRSTPVRDDLALGHYNGFKDSSFRQEVGPLFFGLADLLLRQADSGVDSRSVQQTLRRARDVIERFKAAELLDYFQDECIEQLRAAESRIDELAPNVAVLYLIPLPDRTELLLSFRDEIKSFKVPVSNAELVMTAKTFRNLLEDQTSPEHLPLARRLYDWLIRPIEHELESRPIDTLVLVPDGALRNIPLAALHDGQRFLIERYATAITPGLTLTATRSLRHRIPPRVLAAGLSQSVHDKFSPLEGVTQELDAIGSLFDTTKLLNEAFTTRRFMNEIRYNPYAIVHIASHGQFKTDAQDTFILAYDSKLTLTALREIIQPTRFRSDQPLELVTLSACQTAKGDDRAALGIAGVAIQAGAKSALATLWTVGDQAASELITEFYRQIRYTPGISKAAALRQAQLKLINQWKYRDPFYWSPFLIIGNWL